MRAYKAFNEDMTCRGFQFKEGETYETENASLCNSGFHACEDVLDCLGYYDPAHSVYHEVELEATDEKGDDSKRVGKRIRIGARLSIRNLVDAHIAYVKEHCTNENNAKAGKPATAGFRGAATSRGTSSVGSNGIACARGNGCMVRGGIGSILVIAEEKSDDYDIVSWKSVVVDGETIKADTWYKLIDGELVEAEGYDSES